MRKYLVALFFLIITASILVLIASLIIRGRESSYDILNRKEKKEKEQGYPSEDLSISEYFDKVFEEDSSNSSSSAKVDFETCDLLGERVRQGTVIFDSTCASSE